jgi:3-deoxy-D-manno-octulosonic-acid transferase
MFFYRILSVALFPFIELYLFYRVYKKKEDKKRLKERFGHSTIARPKGEIVWLHAVSVGETNSAFILVDELLKAAPEITILFTSTTLTSASIIAAKIPQYQGRIIHQFLPIDSYFCVRTFYLFWQPKAVIFVESEIWPNLIDMANQLSVPTFLVNARMSEKSAGKWKLAKNIGFKIFDAFAVIFAQSEEDRKRLQRLTKKEVLLYGNLKSQAQNLAFDGAELPHLKSQIGSRKFWIAVSTHKGEEEIVIQTHKLLKKDFPDLLTIIIPRHPNRSEEIKSLFSGINFAQRSQKQNVESATEIYLADSLNELGLFYRLINFAFIGGSLAMVGGHNPFEAIKLECAVISGRNVFNFKEIYKELEAENACAMVDSQEQLAEQVGKFLKDDTSCRMLARRATSVIEKSDSIAQKVVERIDQILRS